MFFVTAALVLLLDQFTKFLTARLLIPGQSVPLVNGILNLTYVQNRGAAFGLFSGSRAFLIYAGIALIVLVLYLYFKTATTLPMKLGLGMVIGGSLGNIIDRILRHYVVDFIDFRVWPVFNVADTMLNIGVVLLIYILVFKPEKKNASDPV
ncbi:MAG TPA: signal peptidase II [Candidatus Omnitrophota bacterium]|nr:signal peptidase II [Candidatus Omnitrophota bacterium]